MNFLIGIHSFRDKVRPELRLGLCDVWGNGIGLVWGNGLTRVAAVPLDLSMQWYDRATARPLDLSGALV